MALAGRISPEQLTTFVLYVEFVTAASLSVCDQWGGIMESIGASERVMEYLDRQAAPQLSSGRTLPNFTGKVCCSPSTISKHHSVVESASAYHILIAIMVVVSAGSGIFPLLGGPISMSDIKHMIYILSVC